MNKKNNAFEKIGSFITGKGFYLVVLICVAAIALSGFYLIRSVGNGLSGAEDQPVSGTAPIVSSSPSPSAASTPRVTLTPSPAPSVSLPPSPSVSPSTQPAPSASPDVSPAPSASPAALVFTWPVNGAIISDYSVEALAYDVTMGDWRTHSGIDLAAPVGTQVKSTAAGTVSAIYEDDLLGTTIVIDHGNDLTSIYANLSAVPTVKAGSAVYTGTVIGTVGRTAPAESGLEAHLHFALFRNDAAVDPLDYLPQR